MFDCDFKIIKSGGNCGVANVVGVIATFPARLRILRIVCVFCVLFPFLYNHNLKALNNKIRLCVTTTILHNSIVE